MYPNAVGFYWTLPVPWVDFRKLPSNVDEAAAASRTIRYQRARIRQYAAQERLRLVHEKVFLEIHPDRGTEMIRGALDAVGKLCREHDALLLYVDFDSVRGWRGHGPFQQWLAKTNVEHLRVSPDATIIDGERFDIHDHFARWRQEQKSWTAAKEERIAKARARAVALRDQDLSYAKIAGSLNLENIRSATGKPWTSDTVRKLLAKADPSSS